MLMISFSALQVAIATNVSGFINTNTTWTLANSPYVMTGNVSVCGDVSHFNPVLTIEPGVVVKANSGTYLNIGYNCSFSGGLQANGTAASPITFQANTASPTAGYWGGIRFNSLALASSITFASIQYGTDGVYALNASPTLHNVAFQNNTTGLRTSGAINPALYANSFSGNTSGIVNATPSSATINSILSWFSSADGPSGSGPGTGQSISSGVAYEPWLISAVSNANYTSSAVIRNKVFNPQIQSVWTFNYATNTSQNWTMTIKNSGGSTVRTLTGSGSSGAIVFDGKDGSGVILSNGDYFYQFDSANAASATGKMTIDSSKTFTVSALSLTYSYFSPNNDSIQETTTVSATSNYDDVSWTLNVRDGSNNLVRTITGVAPPLSCAWDGKNNSGVLQPDSTYSLEFITTEGTSTVTQSVSATLDATYATSSITYPTANQTLSNVYQNGVSDVAITGSASDTNLLNWQLDRGTGSNPSSWTTMATGTTAVVNSTFFTWPTLNVANNTYTIRLQVWDRAGNRTEVRRTVTVSNFSMSKNFKSVNSTSGTITYTSIVPFTLSETITIKNAAGATVRTLFSGTRNAGTYNDVWNGRDATGGYLSDGGYFYVATATAGVSGMTWDLTNQYEPTSWVGYYNSFPAYDPFNNQPLTITYNFNQTGRITFAFSPTYVTDPSQGIPGGCAPPNFCLFFEKYEETGSHTITWAGIDNTGVVRTDIKGYSFGSQQGNFPQNAVVVYGTKPVISGSLITASPPVFMPGIGNQTVNFTVSSFQSQPVTVTVKYLNQTTLSTLRTITVNNVSPGSVSVNFDGRGDNGNWVAPGNYTVTVSVSDSIGNQVSSQILTTIQY